MKQRAGLVLVLLAGAIWGTMGVFVRQLNDAGLFAFEVSQARITIGLAFVGLYLLVFDRQKLKIRLRDLWCFFGTGICSLMMFSWCYYTGMQLTSLSVMGVLLYTAPVFVMLMSAVLFREKLTKGKLLALVMTVAGCCLVSGIGTDTQLSVQGLLLGLGSGFGYALYSIFSRFAINRGYDSWTITFYTFLFCAAGCAFLTDWPLIAGTLAADPGVLIWMVLMGMSTGFLSYVLYTKGLQTMESSRASIVASIEPVVATVMGVVIYAEPLGILNVIGILLVLGGIVVLSIWEKA